MKKTKMINSELSYTISKMGHTDSLTIGDCGLPIPDDVKDIKIMKVSHEEFKKLTKDSKAVVRTGECSPYANIILKSGVVF